MCFYVVYSLITVDNIKFLLYISYRKENGFHKNPYTVKCLLSFLILVNLKLRLIDFFSIKLNSYIINFNFYFHLQLFKKKKWKIGSKISSSFSFNKCY